METLEALVRAVKMYVAIGLVATALHAVAIAAPLGDTLWHWEVTVFWEVVGWSRFLFGVGSLAEAGRGDRRQIRAPAPSGRYACDGGSSIVSSAVHASCVPPLRPIGTAAV